MLTDIRINPDNKLSGYIGKINYPFNYPTTWRLIIFMYVLCSFYRAMHFSAKRGIAIACRLSVRPSVCLSVCLSVCNVGEL